MVQERQSQGVRPKSSVHWEEQDKALKQSTNKASSAAHLPKNQTIGSTARGRFETKFTDLGMQGLGYVMGGGFPTNAVYMMTGEAGSFYQTFAQQALYYAVKNGNKVVYYTVESGAEDVQEDMATFKWDVGEYMDNGSWLFTRLIPPQLKTIVSRGAEDPREENIDLPPSSLAALEQDFLGKAKEGRWSALSLAYLAKLYPEQEITDLVMFWVHAAHTLGGVHFILLPEGVHDQEHVNYLKNLVDGVLSFKFAQGFEQAEGEIEIQKMRRIIPRVKTVRHAIQDDGLAIETTARVG